MSEVKPAPVVQYSHEYEGIHSLSCLVNGDVSERSDVSQFGSRAEQRDRTRDLDCDVGRSSQPQQNRARDRLRPETSDLLGLSPRPS